MNTLEEGTEAALEFGKVQRAGQSKEPLIPAVLQHASTLEVLFIGYVNKLALSEAIRTEKAVLWSTSRDELWRKGASSGDELRLVDVRVNCEQNAVLFLVEPTTGGACHTLDDNGSSRRTCFYRRIADPDRLEFLGDFSGSS